MTDKVVKGVFTRTDDDPGGENWRGKLIEHARQIASYESSDQRMTAYVVLGIFEDGAHSIVHRYDTEKCPVPRRLFPAFIEELVREAMVTEPAVEVALEDDDEEAK
jgi:hypothetical protein